MKTSKSLAGRVLFVTSFVILSAFIFISCDKNDDNKNNNKTMFAISGNASSSQVVPPVSGGGTATITGTFNSGTGQMITTTNWTDLSGVPTTGGFYVGATGVNGSLVGDLWSLGTALSTSGTFSDTTTLTSEQASELKSGNVYFSLSTAANPNGEVRGQLTATPQ
ncbi:MAG TPA: CHRD domain-containing protein [Chitinophagaceae bacterium]|jgi:CHRD domain-containing protein|nr:CHRD domain-containing protein [Chitinophagaceae bacterium]